MMRAKGNGTSFGGVVLAGGLSRRLGRDKAVVPIAGEPLIARVIRRLSQVTVKIVVVVNERQRASVLPLPRSAKAAVDAYPDSGSLGGIFTGLSAAETDWSVVVACDMPFINRELLAAMQEEAAGFDAVVPVIDGRPEPTHAIYSKRCLRPIQSRLDRGELKISGFFQDVNVNFLAQTEVERRDPGHLSFFNINTQSDLDEALSLAANGN